jgi:hypothetical protein
MLLKHVKKEDSILITEYDKDASHRLQGKYLCYFKDGVPWVFKHYRNNMTFGQVKIILSVYDFYKKYFIEMDKRERCDG